jgi:hypothetical protein
MNGLRENTCPTLYWNWSHLLTSLLHCQWQWFTGQYQVSLQLVERALRVPPRREARPEERGKGESQRADDLRKLERQAVERISRGLAPPKQIYDAPYRDLIDWSRYPDWAWPSDPELFQGSVHEG